MGRAPAATALLLALLPPRFADSAFLDFGEAFVFGTAQDSYQFEGSLTADGAGLSQTHVWCAWELGQPQPPVGGWHLCGDVGAGFYAHALEDVALAASLGQKHINIQISWARVMPDGVRVNGAALDWYVRLVDAYLAAGIEPWVSLEVFDYPQALAAACGGWVGRPMVGYFRAFAAAVFARLAGRVTHWFSFHEPNSVCTSYAQGGRFVGPRPNANDTTVPDGARDHYNCVYFMMLAHGEVAALLRAAAPGASLSIISDAAWLEPNTTSAADVAASERNLIWHLGAYFEPLITGDWPPEMRLSDPAGARLPFFTPAESAMLRNSTRFLGLNFYTTVLVAAAAPFPCPRDNYTGRNAFADDQCLLEFCAPDPRCPPAPNPALGWLHFQPDGLRKVLRWLAARYPGTPLLIAENGIGLDGGSGGDPFSSGQLDVDVHDAQKVDILKGYWTQAWLALTQDGVDLHGIFLWSFLDNLEWAAGYAAHFGVVHVNHSRADLQRTPKDSAFWFRDVVRNHGFEAGNATAG